MPNLRAENRCPLCNEAPKLIQGDDDLWSVDCQRCGHFQITFEALTNLSSDPGGNKRSNCCQPTAAGGPAETTDQLSTTITSSS
jgi:hypothetical protein